LSYGAASVRGFQRTNMADPDRVVVPETFCRIRPAEGGRDYNTAEIEYTLRNFCLPQLKPASTPARGSDERVQPPAPRPPAAIITP
jgi:hypothetical protein